MADEHPTAHYRLDVAGMSCANCAAHVKEALLAVEGVSRAKVDLEAGSAMVGGRSIDPEELPSAVAAAGYDAGPAEATATPHHAPKPGADG